MEIGLVEVNPTFWTFFSEGPPGLLFSLGNKIQPSFTGIPPNAKKSRLLRTLSVERSFTLSNLIEGLKQVHDYPLQNKTLASLGH